MSEKTHMQSPLEEKAEKSPAEPSDKPPEETGFVVVAHLCSAQQGQSLLDNPRIGIHVKIY